MAADALPSPAVAAGALPGALAPPPDCAAGLGTDWPPGGPPAGPAAEAGVEASAGTTTAAALFDAPDGASAAGAGGGAGGGGGSLLPQATSAVAHSSAESVALQRRGVEQHFIASP